MPQSSVDIPVSVLVFVWMVLAVILIAQLPLSRFTKKTAPLEAFQDKLGLSGLNAGIFFLVALFWVALFALLALLILLALLRLLLTLIAGCLGRRIHRCVEPIQCARLPFGLRL